MLLPHEAVADAHELRLSLQGILEHDLGCSGIVSLASCNDVIVHLDRDMDRLYALHQTVVHPAKHVAYTAFWIRKVKPVSYAWPLAEIEKAKQSRSIVDEGLELADANERIALYYIPHQICAYVSHNQLPIPQGLTADRYIDNIHNAFGAYIKDESPGPALNNRFEAIIYDMRYRTFGPHHLVHVVNYLLKEAAAWKSSKSSTPRPKSRAS